MTRMDSPRRGAPRRPLGPRKGQAIAEFVIVLPVFMLLVFGIIEMSGAWRTFQVVTNVVREGARQAILPDADETDVRDGMIAGLAANGLALPSPGTQLIIDCEGAAELCSGTGQPTLVRIEYPYTFTLLGPIVAWACGSNCAANFGTVTISSTTIMRKE